MRIILFLFLLFVAFSECCAQEDFIKKYHLNGREAYAQAIDNYDDNFIIAGTRWSLDTTFYIYMGLVDGTGNLLQYDTIPQVDFIIAINRNNDFNRLETGDVFYSSNGTGRTIIYSYDVLDNDLVVRDTLETFLDNFSAIDFITIDENQHILAGVNRDNPNLLNLALYKVVGDSTQNCVIRDTSDRVVPRRIFQNDDETISVLCQQHPSISSVTVAHYLFDSELNLIESSIGDTLVNRTEFSEAIKDSEGNFIFASLRYLDSTFVVGSNLLPMISKYNPRSGVLWDRVIGSVEGNQFITSGWFGITESIEGDGYVAAGTLLTARADTFRTRGAIVKLSNDGDSLWLREFSTVDGSVALTNFNDVVPTSDGYMVVGDEQCIVDSLDCLRASTMLIFRTDAEGRILPDSTSSVITIDENARINIVAYPNPTLEEIYLQHELLRSAKYRLIDDQGRIVREIEAGPALHTFRVPMVDLQSGIYFFQLWEEAKMLGQVKVLKQ